MKCEFWIAARVKKETYAIGVIFKSREQSTNNFIEKFIEQLSLNFGNFVCISI